MSSRGWNYSNKVVLVSGSSSGIGAVIAVEFARAGAHVVITGRNGENLTKVAKECQQVSPNGQTPLVVVADVSKEEDCRRLVAETITTFKQLDVLVNNAGYGLRCPINDPQILSKYDQLMNTNLKAVIYLCHLCVEHLEKTKGNIINISSVAGIKPFGSSFLYCMSKAALDMFSRCLALELGPKGIRVNIVNPAAVRTNFLQIVGLTDEEANKRYNELATTYPVRRVGESIDIANAVLFLASNEASFVTGINFVSDGGSLNASK
ncbi:L-xylulose reductase-like [Oppia nitens]|uniref:L-xylulose reductase-like n=1 Tax=Oppia nitens TaxID=1686743 RepID=UPI0023DAB5EE|nr:L-xylulose reductase-like [Oppia nitens]